MFRQGLRRCARPASSFGSAAIVARPRVGAALVRFTATPAARFLATPRTIASIARSYSTDQSTAATEVDNFSREEDGLVHNFEDLRNLGVHGNLIDALTKDFGYERMTPVQAKTINPALKGTDIVAQAKTGTGKTIAFLLPLLQRMINDDPSLASRGASRSASSDDIRGIVLSPTRELAEQIAVEARAITKRTGLVVQTAVGGTNKSQMLRQTRRDGCHLLVGTPGRVNDLLEDPESGIDAPNLSALVLDEADRMLDVGFERELDNIIGMLPDVQEKERQTMLVSATIPDNVIRLARSMVRPQDFSFVQTIPENESLTHDKVPQHVVPVSTYANVFPTLFELMEREAVRADEDPDSPPFKAIVYFNTTAMVEMAGEIGFSRRRSRQSALSSFVIHSRLTQAQRTRASDLFRKARSGILFSSDVTARGMDFPNVTHVIQVDVPRDRESYIHRLGRTGRQGKYGEGWLLLPPQSVSAGRRMLRGLPLKQDTSLESAEIEFAAEDLPKYHQEFQDSIAHIPQSIMSSAYQSLFSNVPNANEMAEDLYYWVTRVWGWQKPPALSPKVVRNSNLDSRSEFINVRDYQESGERSRFSRQSSGDAFDSMRRNVRSYGASRGGFRSGGGGRGGGRDGGRDRYSRNDRGEDSW